MSTLTHPATLQDGNRQYTYCGPSITVEEAMQPGHPWYELPVPWTNGEGVTTWTFRGRMLPGSEVLEAQQASAKAGRKLAPHEVVRELVESGGCIPLGARLI